MLTKIGILGFRMYDTARRADAKKTKNQIVRKAQSECLSTSGLTSAGSSIVSAALASREVSDDRSGCARAVQPSGGVPYPLPSMHQQADEVDDDRGDEQGDREMDDERMDVRRPIRSKRHVSSVISGLNPIIVGRVGSFPTNL